MKSYRHKEFRKRYMLQIGKSLALIFFVMALYIAPAFAATSIPFTVNLSKAVNVTGTPRIAVDVGGVTRHATYTSGTGTSALIFTYAMVAGDVDLDGATVSSPIDLNGGTIKDLAGNDLSPLTFTLPNTSNVKVNYPSLGMDFIYDADGRYTLSGTVYNDLTSFLTAAGGTFSRTSIGTYFDSAGVLQTAASGVPRFDYDPITHVAKGILMEESRANLLLNSAALNLWNTTNTTMTANTTSAPDGTISADTWTRNSTASSYIGQTYTKAASAITYTQTVYAKQNVSNYVAIRMQGLYPARADMVANLNTGTISTAATVASGFTTASGSIQNVGNGWYRLTLTATTDTDTSVRMYISFNSGGGVLDATDTVSNSSGYLWGAQLEQASSASSYIPTTTATVTRAIDVLSIPTGGWFSGATGTIIGRAQVPSLTQTDFGATLFNFNDNTASNYIWGFMRANGSGQTRGEVVTATASVGSFLGSNSFAINTPSTIGIAYQNSNFAFSAKGASLLTSASGNVPTVNKLNIGSRETGASNRFNGNIAMIKYYPLRASNAQLQLLTQ